MLYPWSVVDVVFDETMQYAAVYRAVSKAKCNNFDSKVAGSNVTMIKQHAL